MAEQSQRNDDLNINAVPLPPMGNGSPFSRQQTFVKPDEMKSNDNNETINDDFKFNVDVIPSLNMDGSTPLSRQKTFVAAEQSGIKGNNNDSNIDTKLDNIGGNPLNVLPNFGGFERQITDVDNNETKGNSDPSMVNTGNNITEIKDKSLSNVNVNRVNKDVDDSLKCLKHDIALIKDACTNNDYETQTNTEHIEAQLSTLKWIIILLFGIIIGILLMNYKSIQSVSIIHILLVYIISIMNIIQNNAQINELKEAIQSMNIGSRNTKRT